MHLQDMSRILQYKSMGQGELWLDCAEKLTAMIQNIIEFAKLIPGFMRLSQDDQVIIQQLHFLWCHLILLINSNSFKLE